MASNKKPPRPHATYAQFAFRASAKEVEELQEMLGQLYEKFNRGRDPEKPGRRRAVKIGEIALEAISIGIKALQKRGQWKGTD